MWLAVARESLRNTGGAHAVFHPLVLRLRTQKIGDPPTAAITTRSPVAVAMKSGPQRCCFVPREDGFELLRYAEDRRVRGIRKSIGRQCIQHRVGEKASGRACRVYVKRHSSRFEHQLFSSASGAQFWLELRRIGNFYIVHAKNTFILNFRISLRS